MKQEIQPRSRQAFKSVQDKGKQTTPSPSEVTSRILRTAQNIIDETAKMIQLDSNLVVGCVAMAAAGVASHLLYFIRGDHNTYAHRWVTRGFMGVGVLAGAVFHFTRHKAVPTVVMTSLFTSSYFTALFTSIGLYRVLFHPLRKFPGPSWAPLSNLCHAYVIRKSDNYFLMQKLHQQYGPIVRTGASTWRGKT